MTLKFYFHPLSSFCHKALIALYEHDVPFERVVVDLGDPAHRESFGKVWPLIKFPALRDEARGKTIAESSPVVEYIDAFYRKHGALMPDDRDLAWEVRMWDQFCDNYVMVPMQKITADNFRPDGGRDPIGVDQARALILRAYEIMEDQLGARDWLVGDTFTLADCAAAPALMYADLCAPITDATPRVDAYLNRLMARPSYARALKEAEPFFNNFPMPQKPSLTRTGPAKA